MKKLVYILVGISILSILGLVWMNKRYQKLHTKYEVSIENIKAYDRELSLSNGNNRVYKLTIDQLNYFNDSILKKMNEVRKELGIKDSKIKQMQYQLTNVEKVIV